MWELAIKGVPHFSAPEALRDMFLYDQERELARRALGNKMLADEYVCTDLPPYTNVGSQVTRPPSEIEFWEREENVNWSKRVPAVSIIGACEFAYGQLERISNPDGTLVSISPHTVPQFDSRHAWAGPSSINYVRLFNYSVPGQSWKEVVVDDELIVDWCEAQPSTTIIQLGLWDILCGHMSWNNDAGASEFALYVTEQMQNFILRAQELSRERGLQPFSPWYRQHKWLFLNIPPWFKYHEGIQYRDMITPTVWTALRKNVYNAIRGHRATLWERFHCVPLSPRMDSSQVDTDEQGYLLSPDSSLRYVSCVFSVVGRLMCDNWRCSIDMSVCKQRNSLFVPGQGGCGQYHTWYYLPGQRPIGQFRPGNRA